jgi:hypothetical protein
MRFIPFLHVKGRKMNQIVKFGLVALVLFMVSGNAYAYLDPGSGSAVLQIIMAVLVGTVMTVKMYWGKIVGLFKKSKPEAETISKD